MVVLSIGNGVSGFQLDPVSDQYLVIFPLFSMSLSFKLALIAALPELFRYGKIFDRRTAGF